jgi:hypothetical protein
MKALFGGFISVFVLLFVFGFLIQYPAIFWTVLFVFVAIFTIGLIVGNKQSDKPVQRGQVPSDRKYVDDDEEGDIRHHYNYGGTPMSIDNPGTIQNQSMSFGDYEDEERG